LNRTLKCIADGKRVNEWGNSGNIPILSVKELSHATKALQDQIGRTTLDTKDFRSLLQNKKAEIASASGLVVDEQKPVDRTTVKRYKALAAGCQSIS
jgi:hypothetical protein